MGAVTAAVREKATFSLNFPDGPTKDVTFPAQSCSLLNSEIAVLHTNKTSGVKNIGQTTWRPWSYVDG